MNWKNIQEKYKTINNRKMPAFYDDYDYKTDFKNVYEPAEDTFLLSDALDLEIKEFNGLFNTVEIGCGSGYVSTVFLNLLSENNITDNVHHVVDINKDALAVAKKIIDKNTNNKVKYVHSDLFSEYKDGNVKFEIIIFNPPYVTTDVEELIDAQNKKDISAAWAGGDRGSEVIYRFIDELKSVINENTVIYLLLSEENNYKEILKRVKEYYDFDYECILKRKAKNENLSVFKFYKNKI